MNISFETFKKPFHSLRFRLLIGFILVVALAIGTVTYFTTYSTKKEFGDYISQSDALRFQRLALLLSSYRVRTGSWFGIQELLSEAGEFKDERLVLINPEGTVVGDTDLSLIGATIESDWSDKSIGLNVNDQRVGKLFIKKKGKAPMEVKFLSSINRSALWGGIIAGVVGIFLAVLYSRRIVNPVKMLTDATRKMEKGKFDTQVEIKAKDEIGELAQAFNSMVSKLQEQEKLRRNMVTDVAHELRTPLSNIKGYLEAVKEGLIEPDGETVESLYQETVLLSRLIDDLQDLTLAEAGELELDRQTISLDDIVLSVVESFTRKTEEKGVDLSANVVDSPLVKADPQRIDQVIRNLLDNALEHSFPRGNITVVLREKQGQAEVAVKDDGVGIPSQELPYVFERFYRVDKSRARDTGGSGLGLTIARQIVEAHGGKIWAESEVGRGTTFKFRLPLS